jgi:hypothetical protein
MAYVMIAAYTGVNKLGSGLNGMSYTGKKVVEPHANPVIVALAIHLIWFCRADGCVGRCLNNSQ